LSASIHFLTQSFCSFLSTWPNHFDLLYLTMAPISLTPIFSLNSEVVFVSFSSVRHICLISLIYCHFQHCPLLCLQWPGLISIRHTADINYCCYFQKWKMCC
jgi:hypothetical protein